MFTNQYHQNVDPGYLSFPARAWPKLGHWPMQRQRGCAGFAGEKVNLVVVSRDVESLLILVSFPITAFFLAAVGPCCKNVTDICKRGKE
jgi:hypothetical protein